MKHSLLATPIKICHEQVHPQIGCPAFQNI